MTDYKMTDEDKKLVFEYMWWKMPCDGNEANRFACLTEGGLTCIKCEFYHPLDGNDMVAAMNQMVEKREWDKFAYLVKINLPYEVSFIEDIIHWIMQPARFFELMGKWLKEKEKWKR